MTQVPAMDQVVESPAEGMPPPSARPAAQPHNVSTASTITAASDTLDMAVSPALSEDGSALVSASWRAQEHSSPDASTKSSDALSQVKEESIGESSSAPQDTPSMPVQKRRRVTRACDECRRKKIKCDGKQPCTHCSVYSYECTYDKPSNRRRNPAPQYIEALEHRLQRAETLLRKFMPEVDLSDPNLDPAVQQEFQNRERARNQAAKSEKQQDKQVQQPENQDSQILSMIETIGQLDLTEGGEWDFHGISSGAVFLRRLREHFGGLLGQDYKAPFLPRAPRLPGMFNLDSPRSSVSSPWDPALQNVYDLPPKEHARTLCLYSFQCATCLLRIVHVPTFFETFERLYQKSPETFGTEDNRTLGLLYAVLALGCVYNFSDDSAHHYQAAMEEGLKYFSTSRLLLQDITECRDLASLQALLYLILFLQATSDLSGCYAFLGIALRAAMRMGLHRHLPHAQLTPIEHESRRRVFYVIRQMDTYVSALLGFPLMLSNQDIDQPLPTEVDDEYITKDGILSPPAGSPSVFEAFNAHAKLLDILAKVIKHIYPLKGIEDCVMSGEKESATYLINYSKIKEIEQELHEWFEKLPEQWRPSAEGPIEVVRIRTLLRFGYAHVQMMLYRPFLHYVSPRLSAGKNVDERYYACAAAGISVARNIVHIGMEIRKKAVVIGPYWFILYTQYFAILSLLFYALENPDKAGSPEILAEATAGRDVIASLSSRSSAADRVTASLNVVFERLPDHLKKGKGRPIPTKKRSLGPKASPIPMPPTTAPGRRSEDSQSHKGSAAQDARRHASHRMSFDTAHRPQNARPGQQFISNFPEMLSMDLSSATGSPESSGTPSTSYRSIPSVPAHQTPGGAANPLYKLDTMMFPSGDPFAYPNQPMADMQTPTSGPHPGQAGPGHHQDAIQFYIPPNVYDDIEGQLLGPVPPYLMQQAQGQQGMDLQSHMYNASGMLGMHTQNTHTQQQHQEQQHHQMTQQRQHRELEEMLADPNFDPNFVEMFPQNYHRQI